MTPATPWIVSAKKAAGFPPVVVSMTSTRSSMKKSVASGPAPTGER